MPVISKKNFKESNKEKRNIAQRTLKEKYGKANPWAIWGIPKLKNVSKNCQHIRQKIGDNGQEKHEKVTSKIHLISNETVTYFKWMTRLSWNILYLTVMKSNKTISCLKWMTRLPWHILYQLVTCLRNYRMFMKIKSKTRSKRRIISQTKIQQNQTLTKRTSHLNS